MLRFQQGAAGVIEEVKALPEVATTVCFGQVGAYRVHGPQQLVAKQALHPGRPRLNEVPDESGQFLIAAVHLQFMERTTHLPAHVLSPQQ
jgi:hypothetical protein